MRNKKSQMEIMGLAIIVILIVIALFFSLFWLAKPAPKQAIKARESVLAANFLNTMLNTDVPDYGNKPLRKLLEECTLVGGDSCSISQDIIDEMLEETLLKWNKDYYFTISGSPDVEQISSGSSCKGEREAKEHPVPVKPGFDITLRLAICG